MDRLGVVTLSADNLTTQFYIGALIGLTFGIIVGYLIPKRKGKTDGLINELQFLSWLMFLIYSGMSFGFGKDPNPIIVAAILSAGYGVKGGEWIVKILEYRKK